MTTILPGTSLSKSLPNRFLSGDRTQQWAAFLSEATSAASAALAQEHLALSYLSQVQSYTLMECQHQAPGVIGCCSNAFSQREAALTSLQAALDHWEHIACLLDQQTDVLSATQEAELQDFTGLLADGLRQHARIVRLLSLVLCEQLATSKRGIRSGERSYNEHPYS